MFILPNGSHYGIFIHLKYIFIFFIPILIFCCSPVELILNSSTLLCLLLHMFVCLLALWPSQFHQNDSQSDGWATISRKVGSFLTGGYVAQGVASLPASKYQLPIDPQAGVVSCEPLLSGYYCSPNGLGVERSMCPSSLHICMFPRSCAVNHNCCEAKSIRAMACLKTTLHLTLLLPLTPIFLLPCLLWHSRGRVSDIKVLLMAERSAVP